MSSNNISISCTFFCTSCYTIYKAKSGEPRIIIGPTFVENGHKASDVYLDNGKQSKIIIKALAGAEGSRFLSPVLVNTIQCRYPLFRPLSGYRMLLPYLTRRIWLDLFYFPSGPAASRPPPLPRPLPINTSVHQCVNNWNLINIIERAYEVANICSLVWPKNE